MVHLPAAFFYCLICAYAVKQALLLKLDAWLLTYCPSLLKEKKKKKL